MRVGGVRGKYCQYTAIDDCTRIRVRCISPREDQNAAIRFPDDLLEHMAFPVKSIQTHNGAEFPTDVHWH